jgi:Dyp-type peroxidase family
MLNQFDPQNRAFFEGIQGNILKAHGRHHTANVFIVGNNGKEAEVKAWLSQLVTDEDATVQSAYVQLRKNVLFKESEGKIDTGLFACIHISGAGYTYLFKGDPRINSFEHSFSEGMKKARTRLNDPKSTSWDAGLRADNHFMLLLAHANTGELAKAVERVEQETQFFADISTIEWGNALINSEGAGIEHFGYVDGVSQPLFFEDEWEAYKQNNTIRNVATDVKFDPRADETLVLVDDPFGSAGAKGSYFVFRKLEQNVKGFKLAEHKLGLEDLNLGNDAERAGAMLVGRFEDGTPVQVDGKEGLIHNAVFNNFDYKTPADNSRCPFHGHIRKTNPRFDPVEENKQVKSNHMMARRGIPFGSRMDGDGPNDGHIYNKPEGGVGLLFMSYQASIDDQFEFIQKNWVNDPDFPNVDHGIDPVIGQGPGTRSGQFATTWNDSTTLQPASFEQFVHLKGGEYFFAPSMSFLKSL